MRLTTLCFLLDKTAPRILLAMKKRGFGKGKWNGPGGKVEPGETVQQAAARECAEETGLKPQNLNFRGVINFVFKGKPEWDNKCHIYTATEWSGQMEETEEMKPEWFSINCIPYKDMWEDDSIWYPEMLNTNNKLHYTFFFTDDGKLTQQQKHVGDVHEATNK